ncbi:LOW QUALITY PROTEIN: SERTA domain-containing protein 1-like [Bombina bombina]|uniref:LOW QUALITY PROTEIN: SERTA domain-containing protein 1-like n=1 Tax=Bombina bombina TaxID=8345 RepID=UPI00235ABF83|nr:LOW QUALITY PROTEIN: SERTA domain-containing protein 1-like [Bombina bombina]
MLAKGVKRKLSEVDEGMGNNPENAMMSPSPSSLPAVQSHCLMNISLVKLHHSLRHVEPNFRHLALVANTLRRLQDNMQTEQTTPAGSRSTKETLKKDYCKSSGMENKKLALDDQGEDPLLSCMDASLYSSISTILEDSNNFEGLSSPPLPHIDNGQLCFPKDNNVDMSREDSGKLTPSSSFVRSSPYLLGDKFEDIFEDIDTSIYDSDPWSSSNLLNFKSFSNINETDEKTLMQMDSIKTTKYLATRYYCI